MKLLRKSTESTESAVNKMEDIPNKKTFKSYLYFWSGQLFSLFGSMVVHFVIMWWITVETQSAMYLAVASFLFIICQVIALPFAGVIADKLNKKTIILVADSSQAFATFILLIFFQLNIANIGLVLVFISLRSVFQAFHLPTVNSIIPTMVPEDNLSRVNGVNFLFTGVVQIIAPLSGAILMIFLPINIILWIDILTFCIAVIPIVFIKIPSVKNPADNVEKISFVKEFKIGIKTIKLIPGLVVLIGYSMVLNFLIMPFDTLLPYYINVVHAGSATHLAIVLVFFQSGMIVGALTTTIKKNWNNKLKIIFICIIITFTGYAIMAIPPPGQFLVIGIGGIIMGLTLPIINSLYQTIMQIIVPKDKMGRVNSLDHSLSMSISPIGSIISGPLAELFGAGNLFLYSALFGIIVTALTWRFTSIRRVDYESKLELELIGENVNSLDL
jgi:DHA3 family macrolide efflux protein-like MFS transporter